MIKCLSYDQSKRTTESGAGSPASGRAGRSCSRWSKAVLLRSEHWEVRDISQALRIHEDTVWRHLSDYAGEQKLKPTNGGSKSKLDHEQTEELIAHVESQLYVKVSDICAHVKGYYGVHDSVSGMTRL